jgi:RNA polymerase sigma factor (sigma-70 family)
MMNDSFEDMIESLTENQKKILRKIYKEGYTEKEVAVEFGINQSSVHKAKIRALKKLRKAIQGIKNF